MIAFARDLEVEEAGQDPMHISTVFPKLFEQLDFGMAANSPDPEAKQAALERLRKAGYSEAVIQTRIARFRAVAHSQMNE